MTSHLVELGLGQEAKRARYNLPSEKLVYPPLLPVRQCPQQALKMNSQGLASKAAQGWLTSLSSLSSQEGETSRPHRSES